MDKIEDQLGRPSCYQIRCIAAAAMLLFATSAFPQSGVFDNAEPRHRCSLPAFNNQTLFPNVTENEAASLSIPHGESCFRYSYEPVICQGGQDLSCLENVTGESLVPCDKGYTYDQTYFDATVVSEWDLVCNNKIWNAFVKSLYFAGALCGSPPSGYLVDWYGRKPSLLILCLGNVVTGIGCALSPNFLTYCVFRFFLGFFSLPCCTAVYSYANEMAGRKYRTYVGIAVLVMTALTHITTPVVMYGLRNWRYLNMYLALVGVPFLIMYPFISESPRWLVMKRKPEKANKVVIKYARSKSKKMDEEKWIDSLQLECNNLKDMNDRAHISDLLKRPFTRIVTLGVVFCWFSVCAVFYGMVLNVGTLVGDPYVNAVLNASTEMGAVVIYTAIVAKLGSRFCVISGMFLSGIMCFIATFAKLFDQGSAVPPQIVRWSSITGKFFISVCFLAVYQYTADVHATVSRGKATAISAMFGRIGSVVIPLILVFRYKAMWIPDVVFGCLSIATGVCCIILPNTSSKVLLTSMEEAEDYYKSKMSFVRKMLRNDNHSEMKTEGKEVKQILVDDNENTITV